MALLNHGLIGGAPLLEPMLSGNCLSAGRSITLRVASLFPNRTFLGWSTSQLLRVPACCYLYNPLSRPCRCFPALREITYLPQLFSFSFSYFAAFSVSFVCSLKLCSFFVGVFPPNLLFIILLQHHQLTSLSLPFRIYYATLSLPFLTAHPPRSYLITLFT